MSRTILGVNSAYHESSAALIVDGQLVAAVEEERFTGIRHAKHPNPRNAAELPWHAINACLETAGCGWMDLTDLAYSLDPHLRLTQADLGPGGTPLEFGDPLGEHDFRCAVYSSVEELGSRTRARVHFVPHHLAHAYYAVGSAGTANGAVLVIDGIGEGATISVGHVCDGLVTIRPYAVFPQSVGLAWEKACRFLGYSNYDACKLMAIAGSAPHPEQPGPRLFSAGAGGFEFHNETFGLIQPDNFEGLQKLCGHEPLRRSDPPDRQTVELAQRMQRETETLLYELLKLLKPPDGCSQEIAYSGGVALNCAANSDAASKHSGARLVAAPASNDAGTSLGAAWQVHREVYSVKIPVPSVTMTSFPGVTVEAEASSRLMGDGWTYDDSRESTASVSDALCAGNLVGWIVGRCEFGPRALGARSLLADASSPEVASRVNRAKGRHSFEPVAVSIRDCDAADWFEISDAFEQLTAFMLALAKPSRKHAAMLRHLTNGDSTVRIHSVSEEQMPQLYRLLTFHALRSALPMLVHTSLNPRGAAMPARLNRALPLLDALDINHLFVDDKYWIRNGAENHAA